MKVNKAERTISIGLRLAEERNRLGMSQATFAGLTGVKPNTVGNHETGKTAPDARNLVAAGTIGVDVVYVLFGRREAAQPLGLNQISTLERRALALLRESELLTAESKDPGAGGLTLISKFRNLDQKDRSAILRVLDTMLRAPRRHGLSRGDQK
ncbi:helix-turn-helix transcriptional regulator [Robbsia sp. KACC 23696]|uniref:helix-turn-helix domain-containing protein n=1 Tax=Robbsia sp. KACC 23696 TaxID=3149231 RepID=UPI00325BA70C